MFVSDLVRVIVSKNQSLKLFRRPSEAGQLHNNI